MHVNDSNINTNYTPQSMLINIMLDETINNGVIEEYGEDVNDVYDNNGHLPLAFTELRHSESIESLYHIKQSWRMKERMKTVSVALVMCLNIGVDPPDIVKPKPCSKLECWTDPLSFPPQKALESIGANLLKQYERWQPRARYKQSLDPNVDEVKKLCTSLRRNAKDERVLFHYNGHGVPKPTVNGEIWVFNRSYTQYIPLSIYDLQQWMGAPSIYVYDCSCAGLIIESFKQFAVQHEKEYEMNMKSSLAGNTNNSNSFSISSPPQYKNCIQLAACAADQLLPMNPDLPADLFTSCLTTPIKIALRWFICQSSGKLVPGITLDLLEKIPGQLTDRRTMLGELNWIFTAITDTIAWNVLPKDLFQRLFRQDLLVASLFRNFLLAERIMRSYDCTPISSPTLPSTYHHPFWHAWDLAVDLCLSQLPAILEDNAPYRHSPFFAEQLTAFEVWLSFGSRQENRPEQLPIVLQVLLSQVHRSRALELLGRFLDLGPWAVNLALSVGIFPYVLKLLQSSARELRPFLVFIWSKVLVVDGSCQTDLVRDNGHRYFSNILSDPYISTDHRAMAAFVMSCIVKNHPIGQEAVLQGNIPNDDLIDHCLEQLNDPNPLLRQWLAICLGRVWENYERARWIGARNTAHEKLFVLLDDTVPEVRAAAIFALGTFVNSVTERTDHANAMDHTIAITLMKKVSNDSSPIVRKELIVALHWLVLIFENQFVAIIHEKIEEEKSKEKDSKEPSQIENTLSVGTPPFSALRKVASRDKLSTLTLNKFLNVPTPVANTIHTHHSFAHITEALTPPNTSHMINAMKRVNSSNSLSNYPLSNTSFSAQYSINNVYRTIWKTITSFVNDPHPDVSSMANAIIEEMKSRAAFESMRIHKESHSEPSFSEPASPQAHHSYMSESPTTSSTTASTASTITASRNTTPVRETTIATQLNRSSMVPPLQHSSSQHISNYLQQFQRKRTIFGREPSISAKSEDGIMEESTMTSQREPIVTTEFVDWCSKHFSQTLICYPEELDPESASHHEKEWRLLRNSSIREEAKSEMMRIDPSRIDELLFHHKNPNEPRLMAFHPYEPRLIVAEKDSFSIWNLECAQYQQQSISGLHLGTYSNLNSQSSRISSMQMVNPHDITLLMIACDDGTTRIWRNCGIHEDTPHPELVTAFHIFSDMQPSEKGSGVVLYWNQIERKLIASGETRVIRLWDAQKEMKIRDLATGTDSFVTSISSDERNLICVGCGDGSVRVFDDRLMPHDSRVRTFYEQKNWIINAHIFPDNSKHVHIISGSLAGELKWYDKRLPSSIKSISTGIGMTAMSVHPEADIFACGLGNQALANGYQSINIYTLDAILGSSVRHSEGFMSQRWAPVCSLAFHPLKAVLAAGCIDNIISIFGPSKYF